MNLTFPRNHYVDMFLSDTLNGIFEYRLGTTVALFAMNGKTNERQLYQIIGAEANKYIRRPNEFPGFFKGYTTIINCLLTIYIKAPL